jgi:hypothetical protein
VQTDALRLEDVPRSVLVIITSTPYLSAAARILFTRIFLIVSSVAVLRGRIIVNRSYAEKVRRARD